MKQIISILFFLIPVTIFATPQDGEVLIYNGDTIIMDNLPLEDYREINSGLDAKLKKHFPWQTSTCWRGYHGIWKVINDSLYLVKLQNDLNENGESKEFELSLFFKDEQVCEKGVFAFWYSSYINTHYGKFLDYNDKEWFESPNHAIYSGRFYCSVTKGVISKVKISMKSEAEIESILKSKLSREDTSAFLVVNQMPKFKLDTETYKDESDFIQKHVRFPNNSIDCQGRCYVSFIVEKNGTISNLSVLRPLCPDYNDEALRVISLMNDWEPGKHNGKIVRVKMMYPVNFILN